MQERNQDERHRLLGRIHEAYQRELRGEHDPLDNLLALRTLADSIPHRVRGLNKVQRHLISERLRDIGTLTSWLACRRPLMLRP